MPSVPMIPALLATVLFCFSAVSATRASRLVGGVSSNFWRLLFATALLALWAHLRGQGWGGGALGLFFLSGIVGFGIGDLALYQALPRLGSRLTLLLVHCLAAPSAALSEWWWMGTTLTWGQMGSGLIILMGVTIVLYPERQATPLGEASRQGMIWGVIYGVIAALGQGIGAAMSRVAYGVLDRQGFTVDGLTAAYQRILGGLFIAWIAYVALRWARHREGQAKGMGWASAKEATPWILGTGLAGPFLGVSCYQWALQDTPSGLVLPIVALTPLVVMPLSAVMEGDRPGLRAWIGGGVAVLGVILLGRLR